MVLYGTLMIVMVQVRPGEVRHPRPGAGRQRGPALQHPLRPGRGHLHGHPPAQDRGQHPPGAVQWGEIVAGSVVTLCLD